MKRFTLIATFFLLLVLAVAATSFAYGWQGLNEPLEQSGTIYIEPGTPFGKTAAKLAQGDEFTELAIKIYGRYTGKGVKIRSGEYTYQAEDTLISLIDKMVAGDVKTYTVTLIEGSTIKEAIKALHKSEVLIQKLPSDWTYNSLLKALNINDQTHPEGLFFPDTYQIQKGMTDIDVLKRSHKRLKTVLEQEWQKREKNLPLKSAYEALILASIIEKETGVAHEREQIAGVFTRRMQKGMRLQTDPTVIYGLGDRYKGNITRKHLREKTAYNTYTIPRLPPTPIALAGKEAIYAALHPDLTKKDLYFVAKGDGSHYFSETLSQHRKAVRQYQINQRKKQYRSAPK